MLVVVAYGVLIVVGLTREINILKIPKYALWSLSIIWFLYLLNLGMDVITSGVQVSTLIRVPAFIIFTAINLFFLPNLVSRRTFLTALTNFATVLVALGLPTLFIPQFGVGPIQIERWHSTFYLLPGDNVEIYMIKSIFRNPNTLSFVTAVGLISAFGRYFEHSDWMLKIQIFILTTGLYLAHGRASMAAAGIGIVLIIMYEVYEVKRFRQLTVLILGMGIVSFLLVSGIIPSPPPIPTINLQGRIELWKGGVRAVTHQPLLGYGPGDTGELIIPFVNTNRYVGTNPHNSYLRMFVTTGLIGGISYVLFISKVIFDQFFRSMSSQDLALFGLCIVITLTQFFAAFSLFGLSLTSVVASLTYGYGIHTIIVTDSISQFQKESK
jgi:O-antigen ligase